MYIRNVELRDFRAFADEVGPFELGKNITCIAGHNGTGKTTLLAVLSNCAELNKSKGAHLNGRAFRGEYADVIKGDRNFDTSGDKVTVQFADAPESEHLSDGKLNYRATFQKRKVKEYEYREIEDTGQFEEVEEEYDIDRYRLIPVKTETRKTERKVSWPSYYLGLSRLFPLGESADHSEKNLDLSESLQKELAEAYRSILSMNHDVVSSQISRLDGVDRKRGVTIETESYGASGNSSGQDNLGQIILTMLSFEELKRNLGEEFQGGLVVIDEIEATLHPAAQVKLYDYLYRKAKEIGIQVVFTTHSLHLLNHVATKTHEKNPNIKLMYFSTARGNLEYFDNPSPERIENDLLNTMSTLRPSVEIPVITEDDAGRGFLRDIFESTKSEFSLKYSEGPIACTTIAQIAALFPASFGNSVIVFDPDVASGPNREFVQHNLWQAGIDMKLHGQEIDDKFSRPRAIFLPGEEPIEMLIWDHISSLPPNDKFYYWNEVDRVGITRRSLVDDVEMPEDYKTKLQECKSWMHSIPRNVQHLMHLRWIEDHQLEVNEFVEDFRREYERCMGRSS